MRAYRIAVTRPFITNPDEQTFHPYLIEIPIVMMTLCVLGSYKVEYHILLIKNEKIQKKISIMNSKYEFDFCSHYTLSGIRVFLCLCLPITS